MRKLPRFYRNIPLTLSVGAYMALATTATTTGLLTAVGLTALSYAVGFFVPNVWGYTKANARKGHWAAAIAVCVLMGLRFDSVWKNSGQLQGLLAGSGLDVVMLLSVMGCILAAAAVFFVVSMLTFLTQAPKSLKEKAELKKEHGSLSKTFCVALAVILVLQLAMLCWFGLQKQGFHVDEVYTFELSNYTETIYGDQENAYAAWTTGAAFTQILEPADGRLFDISVPFWNGETDNHPSTYYILVNVVSSIFKMLGISVNKWAGLIPNFICALVTTWFFALIMRKLLGSDLLALAGVVCWVFSVGAIGSAIYLRMYALQIMAAMIFIWLHLQLYHSYLNKNSAAKWLAMVQIATIAGILSQYYFLFFAFFFCGCVCVYLLVKKDWKMLRCYMQTEIFAVAAAELLFPRMVVRLLFGDRGTEALDNMLNGSGYWMNLRSVLEIVNQQLFGGYGVIVLIICAALMVLAVVLEKKFRSTDLFALLLLAVAGGYILAVTKIAPYQTDRYFMCVFPVLTMCASYAVGRGVLAFCGCIHASGKAITVGTALALAAFTLWNTANGNINYIYASGADRTAVLAEYGSLPVVALNGDFYNDSVLNWAFEFQNREEVFLCRNNMDSDLAIAAADGKLDEGFLLYVHQDQTETGALLMRISDYLDVDSCLEVSNTQGCRVLYCTLKQG